jgi:hypothetical protein
MHYNLENFIHFLFIESKSKNKLACVTVMAHFYVLNAFIYTTLFAFLSSTTIFRETDSF